jgi:hypothetical protein
MSNQNSLAIQKNGLVAQSLSGMSRPLARQTTREMEYVAKRAILAHAHEEGRAQLAQTAMMNTAQLGILEERLVKMSPLAASALEGLTEAYAIGAIKAVMTW